MPTYDYRCRICGHEMAVFQSITEDSYKTCPGCGEDGLHRLIGAGAGIIFKGSGFYETDYKRNRSSSPDKPSPSKPAEKKPSEKKSDDSSS